MAAKCIRETVARNKRRGLQKLECPGCPGSVYVTWAQAEQLQARGGLPVCPCGERYEPVDFELGLALELDTGPVRQFYAHAASIESHRTGAVKWGEETRRETAKTRDGRMSVEELAAARVEQDRTERAHAARLNAIRPAAEPMPF